MWANLRCAVFRGTPRHKFERALVFEDAAPPAKSGTAGFKWGRAHDPHGRMKRSCARQLRYFIDSAEELIWLPA